MLVADSGQRTQGEEKNEDGEPIPGYAGSGETGSNLFCPDAGCAGTVSGKASVDIGQGGLRSTSTGAGNTACDGTGPCQAGIRITTSAASTAAGVQEENRFAATSVTVAASCDNGTDAGCGIHATSNSDVTGAEGVHATATATCAGGAGCLAGTSGMASPGLAQVSYQCVAAGGCAGHSAGTAEAGNAGANAGSDCRVGGSGECAGSTLVGASTDGSAMAGASCQGSGGAACRYHFEATASDSSRDGSSSAKAYAHGSQTGEMGGGTVQVMAKTYAKGSGAAAQAMCQGTAGVKCGYHFEATASSFSRDGATWARAYAHGSQSGEMGGGAVRVMARTFARGPDAQAYAVCVGAKNCTSPYTAHAEAHDRLDQKANPQQPNMPSGYWTADGAGTCRGNGKGGCGVHAWANAGPGGSGGASCTGPDCSGFRQEQGGPSAFTKTGPSWNQMLAAQAAARRAHQVKNIDEVLEGLKPGDSFLGYTKGKDGYTIYTKEAGGEVTTRTCPASECKPGHAVNGGNGQITFPEQGNPQTSQQSTQGHDNHTCRASVGCALTNHGTGDSDYWLEGNGEVHDGITGSTMHFEDNQPIGGGPANRNEGSFGNTKGKPFMFTCNGGCQGSVSNIDLGKGKFTDQIDLEGTPNLLIGRDGLGNLGDYSHQGLGTITLMKRDGTMMEPIVSGNDLYPQRQETDGLTPEEWADVVTKYGYTPWDVDILSRVLGPGDSLIGYRANGDGDYTIYVKEPDGGVTTCLENECAQGGEVTGGRGKVTFPDQGDPTATQTSAPGRDNNTCTASVSCGLATDGNGNGMWWMQGNGNVHDGISGSTVTYRDSAPESRNSGTWGNTHGSPFTASCLDGCSGDIGFGDKKDHFEFDNATNVLLTSRDAFGNAGRITWAGKGFYRSAEGDKVWADLSRVAYDPNNETRDDADNTTLIVTRDAAGNPGYYALPTGQTGRIETIEGYVVDNRHNDRVDPNDFSPEDAYNFEHYTDTLRVTTPNGDGKGGVLVCGGRCTVTGPGLDLRNTTCESCYWAEYLATGEGPHPGGWREVSNNSGAKTWYTPTGDELTCDGCQFVQYNRDKNGNGGGAVCAGMGAAGGGVACSGKSREGTEVSDPEGLRMLYANADGSHQGWSCKSNSDSCGNKPELRFDWKGDPDATWALVLDPDYRRSSTGTQMDKDLARKLGLDEGDPLPPLTADALSYLEKTDPEAAERYKNSLPIMSGAETAGMGFTYLEMQSTDRRLEQKYGPIYDEKIKPVLDAYQAANSDNALDAGERHNLQKRFDALEGIDPGLIYEWSAARGVIDGVDDATWVRPEIREVEARLGGNPQMVQEMAGPEPVHPDQPGYGLTPMERALENARRDLGVDESGNPTGPYNVNQNALLSFRPRQVALDLNTAGHVREVADYNRQAEAFGANGGSVAEQQRLMDWEDRLDRQWNGIVDERLALKTATADLKGPEDQAKQARLRAMDLAIGRGSGDRIWSDRLTAANEQLTAIQEVRDSLDRNDPQQKTWAEKLDEISGLASLNYTAISRNLEERADDNPLGRLSLPSTGHPDFYYAMVAGKNLPEFDDYRGDLKEYFTSLSRDELANLASHQSVDDFEGDIRGRALREGEHPAGDVLKAIKELGGDGYRVDAERMLYRHGGQDEWQPMLVYRVLDKDGDVVGYVDATGANFDSLNDYRNANVLPDDSDIISREDWSDPNSPLKMTTAHHTSGVEKAMDYVVAPGAIILGGIAIVASPLTGPAAPVVAGVGWGGVAFGTGYFIGKSVGNIIVRAQHGQSNGFDNPAAVADYITLGATAFVGVGSVVRPIATTAAGAVMRGAGMTAFTGMYAHSAVDTFLNWDTMTPGQQRDSIYGLTSGGLMLLTPLAARGIRAAYKPGMVPGQVWAGRNPHVGGTLNPPVADILSVTLPRGRSVTPQQIKSGGDLSLGSQVRSVVEQLGAANGRGGRIMTSAEVAAALHARGVKVPSESALRDAINSTPGIDYVGDPSIGGIVRTGTNEFGGARMSLEGPAPRNGRPARQQVSDILDRAGWPEATRDGQLAAPKVEQLADPAIFREVEATVAAQEAGRIVGMRDWLQYNANKAPEQLAEAAAELRVARELANDNPGMVVRVGLEQNAPLRPGTDQRMK